MAKSRNRLIEGEYKRAHWHYKSTSPILNPASFGINETIMQISSRHGLETLLYEYTREAIQDGDDGGKIQLAKNKVEKIEAEFAYLKQAALRMGKKPPKEMPADVLERYHTVLAWLDVKLEEADKIKKLLKETNTEIKKVRDSKLLKYGPIGVGRGDPLRELDGQIISQNRKGVLVIEDDRSPYDGMLVVDYREKVMKPFLKSRKGSCRAVRWDALPARPKIKKKKVKAS